MKKPDMRKVLLDMAGDVSDTQVAGEDEDLNFILSFVSEKGLTMSDAAKLVKQNLTAYNAEQQNISPRIDEVRRMMPEEQDWEKLEAGQERGREYLRQIDAQLATGNASLTVMKKKQGEMFALESRIEQLKQSRLEKANQEYRDLLRQKESVEGIIRACRLNEQQFKDTIDEETQNVTRYTAELKQLAEDYKRYAYMKKQEVAKAYEVIQEGVCDRCGQKLPEDQLIRINAESEARFTAQKEAEIAKLDRQIKDITERGTELSNRKKDRLERSEKAKAGLAKATEERQIAEKTLEDLSQKLSGQTLAIAIDLTGDVEYEKMLAEVNRLKAEIEKPEDNSVLLENKEKITRQMETIRKLLEGRSERVRAQERIAQLENRGKELSGLIAIEKRKQIAIENFNRRKAEMLEESINDLFDGVTFRLFEQQINGGIADDCTPLINGVEFKDASHSEQIRAGQSIVNAFQKQEHTFVPVFIDNAEACNYFIPMQTQVIKLFVSEDEQIRIVKEQ
jgi:DNA repair exonuclease SbcCD ATPase subunit